MKIRWIHMKIYFHTFSKWCDLTRFCLHLNGGEILYLLQKSWHFQTVGNMVGSILFVFTYSKSGDYFGIFGGNCLGIITDCLYLWEFFGNSFEILWEFFENSFEILWEFFGYSLVIVSNCLHFKIQPIVCISKLANC